MENPYREQFIIPKEKEEIFKNKIFLKFKKFLSGITSKDVVDMFETLITSPVTVTILITIICSMYPFTIFFASIFLIFLIVNV